jgi:hypothetical protein
VPRLGRTVARSSSNEQIDFLPAVDGPISHVDRAALWLIPFEDAAPIRTAPNYKGQRNYTGEWWCATTERHVAYESRVERDFLMSADFDSDVVGIAVQPFTFRFFANSGSLREHTPDVFLRHRNGDATVVDVRPDARIDNDAKEAFEASRRLCDEVGWSYCRIGEQPSIRAANLRWLAGYRNVRNRMASVATSLIAELQTVGPMTISALASAAGDPVLVLPTLYHLMWTHEISVDVSSTLLNMNTIVEAAPR